MKLTELEPRFSRVEQRMDSDPCIAPAGGNFGDARLATFHEPVDTLAEAQQITFLCPACFTKNGGRENTHKVIVGFRDRGLPDDQSSQSRNGGASRWAVSGTGYADLTLHPSIDCGCWHGHVQNGDITP